MGFEVLGISLIIPAVALFTQTTAAHTPGVAEKVLIFLGNPKGTALVAWVSLIFFIIYSIKTLYLVYLSWKQASFVNELNFMLTKQLFSGYLEQPYVFHLQRNSAELINNSVKLVSDLTSYMNSVVTITTECFAFTGILAFILVSKPFVIIPLLFLFLSTYGFFNFFKGRTLRYGLNHQKSERMRLQDLQQGFGGIKEIKLFGRQSYFIAQYNSNTNVSVQALKRYNTLQQMPRIFLDYFLIIMVCVLIISLSLMGIEPVSIATLFGLLGAAIFRTLPFISRVTSSIQSLRFGKSAVDALTAEIDFVQTNRQPDVKDIPLSFEHEVTVENVSYTYPAIDKQVLDNINVNIPIGATIGIIGTTGAGKSTFVDVFLGLLNPTGGSVKCDGVNIDTNIRGWQNKIGYVPQNIFLTDDSIRKNIAFGFHEEQINEELLNNAIDAAQLRHFISELPEGLDTLVGERGVRLSGGQRQRIGIARALYLEPSILVFDEATSSLDIHTEAEFIQSVSKLKGTKTILIVAHRLQTIMHCDTVYRIEQGRIVEKNNAATILKNYQEN